METKHGKCLRECGKEKTTQVVITQEESASDTIMRRRYKKRYLLLNCRYLQDTAYADIMHVPKAAVCLRGTTMSVLL